MTEHVDIEVKEDLQPIELEQYDASQHAGKRVKIERVSTHMTDRFKEKDGSPKKSYYVKAESEVLDTIEKNDGTTSEVRASRIYGLQQDAEGKLGWTEKSKLAAFLKAMSVSSPSDLVGKEVVVNLTDPDKNGNRFCTF